MLQTILDDLTGTFTAVSIEVAAMRLAVAIALGGIIGFEREHKEKAAGLRTHILISMAACMFVLVAQEIAQLPFGGDENRQIDPLRLIEAVTAGVAFLAAGAIFTQGGHVKNLTTGAGMWLAGAVGLACGTGHVPLAALATFMCVVILWALRHAER